MLYRQPATINKIVLASAIMAATGAIFANTFQLARAMPLVPITPPDIVEYYVFLPPQPITQPSGGG